LFICVLQRELADAAQNKKASDNMMLALCGTRTRVDSWLSDSTVRKWFAISCLFSIAQAS